MAPALAEHGNAGVLPVPAEKFTDAAGACSDAGRIFKEDVSTRQLAHAGRVPGGGEHYYESVEPTLAEEVAATATGFSDAERRSEEGSLS